MFRICVRILVLVAGYQVTAIDFRCDPNIPDSPNCADYTDTCQIPERAALCPRYCGKCDNPTTTTSAPCKDSSPLCSRRKGQCSEKNVSELCPVTCGTCPTTTLPTSTSSSTKTTKPPTSTKAPIKPTTSTKAPIKPTTTTKTPTKPLTTTEAPTKPPTTTKPPTKPPTTTKPSTEVTSPTQTSTEMASHSSQSPATQTSITTTTKIASPPAINSNVTEQNATTIDLQNSTTANQETTTKEMKISTTKEMKISTTKEVKASVTKSVDKTSPTPITESSTAATTKSASSSFRNAINVKLLDGNSIQIKIVASGYLKHGPLDEIISEVEDLLKDHVTNIRKADVEDGTTDSGKPVTILTLKGDVKPSKTPGDLEKELNDDSSSFRNELNNRLLKRNQRLHNGPYNIPQASPTEGTPWAESNWYIIFIIAMIVLIIIGLVVLSLTTASSRKRAKLRLKEKQQKLALTRI